MTHGYIQVANHHNQDAVAEAVTLKRLIKQMLTCVAINKVKAYRER